MSRDIKVDPVTNDMFIDGNDIAEVTGLDYISQKVKIRLLFVFGEWFLDTALGVPYFQEIWVKNPDIERVNALLRKAITDTPGVVQILEYDSSLNKSTRTFTVSFKAETDEGLLTFSEDL